MGSLQQVFESHTMCCSVVRNISLLLQRLHPSSFKRPVKSPTIPKDSELTVFKTIHLHLQSNIHVKYTETATRRVKASLSLQGAPQGASLVCSSKCSSYTKHEFRPPETVAPRKTNHQYVSRTLLMNTGRRVYD